MTKNYKKDILSQIVDSEVYGAPSAGNVVKFQFASGANATVRAAASQVSGSLTFSADNNGNAAIYAQGVRVSSAIQKVEWGAQSGNKHGGKTVTVTWISDGEGTSGQEGYVAPGTVKTDTFNVIDETALEAYFIDSSTIALNASTNKYEVRLVENGGLKVNENGGLEIELGDVVNVDEKTIVSNDVEDETTHEITKGVLSTALAIKYVAATPETSEGAGDATKARIALFDKNGGNGSTELSAVEVEDIIGSGIVKSTAYDEATGHLVITWDSDPETTTDVDLTKLLDVLNDVVIDSSSLNYMTATPDTSIMKLGLTEKSRDAIDAAETAIQTITSENLYLTVGEKTGDANNKSVALTVETGDLSITAGDIATGLDTSISGVANKLAKSDDTASKVQTFVNARIAEEVAKLDSSAATAELSATAGSEVYVKVTGAIVDGKFDSTNGLTVDTLIGASDVSAYVKADSTAEPAVELVDPSISFTPGLVTDKELKDLVSYTNDKVKQLKDELDAGTDALDASIAVTSDDFVDYGFEQNDGKVEHAWIDVTYGAFGSVSRDAQNVASAAAATDGIGKVSDTQTWVMGIINGLDVAAADVSDGSFGFVATNISETDGLVKNESVSVTYGVFAHAGTDDETDPSVNASDGVATITRTTAFIEEKLTWTII